MGFNEGPEIKALIARLEDLVSAVERGELGLTPFLTPRELYIAEDYLTGCGVPYAAYGGYSLA